MSKRTELSSILILLSLTQINANHDLFTDFVSNVLVDNQFSDGFFSELLAAKYIFENDRKYFFWRENSNLQKKMEGKFKNASKLNLFFDNLAGKFK